MLLLLSLLGVVYATTTFAPTTSASQVAYQIGEAIDVKIHFAQLGRSPKRRKHFAATFCPLVDDHGLADATRLDLNIPSLRKTRTDPSSPQLFQTYDNFKTFFFWAEVEGLTTFPVRWTDGISTVVPSFSIVVSMWQGNVTTVELSNYDNTTGCDSCLQTQCLDRGNNPSFALTQGICGLSMDSYLVMCPDPSSATTVTSTGRFSCSGTDDACCAPQFYLGFKGTDVNDIDLLSYRDLPSEFGGITATDNVGVGNALVSDFLYN